MANDAYRDAGVDVEAGYEAVRLMKEHVKKTLNANVLGDLGSFGGFYSIEDEVGAKPILVAGTDGVGTKLKVAFAMDVHDTVGQDCVAMCVNDIICQGAKPLFFLDYLATGKLDPLKAAQIVKGVADGCEMAGCALIGGETAEMPGFYPAGEYDMAGFAVGIVDRSRVITGQKVVEGDALVGLASSGVHSNGFSLVRKLMGDDSAAMNTYMPELSGTVGQALLAPTRIYVKPVLDMLGKLDVHGVAHITGGGFYENLPRMYPAGLCARVKLGSWETPPIFGVLQRAGGLAQQDMFGTFNNGIGMFIALPQAQADEAIAIAASHGVSAWKVGEMVKGDGVDLV